MVMFRLQGNASSSVKSVENGGITYHGYKTAKIKCQESARASVFVELVCNATVNEK
jgi:hypothetical protein